MRYQCTPVKIADKTKQSKQQYHVVMKTWSHRNSHTWLQGMQNGIVTLENNLTDSSKMKHALIIYLTIPVLGIQEKWKCLLIQTPVHVEF